jgi:hypothetical protein
MNNDAQNVQQAQRQFAEIMPHVQRIAKYAFRYMDADAREDAVAEAVALAWQNHLHCSLAGKSPGAPSIAHYAVKNVRCGRRFAGTSSTDVHSEKTQMMGRATVSHTGNPPDSIGDGPTTPLIDHRTWMRPFHRTRVEMDYPDFLEQEEVTDQERTVFAMLAEGRMGKEIAAELDVSQPRVCQIKKSLSRKLVRFFGREIYPDYHVLPEHSIQ